MDSANQPHILRAITPRTSDLSAYLYWDAATDSWGRFDDATRYPTPQDLSPPAPCPEADIGWMQDLPRDLDGYPYVFDSDVGEPWRVTPCCAAMVSIADGPLYCKSCYDEAELAVDTPARLDANWDPGDGPVQFHFPLS